MWVDRCSLLHQPFSPEVPLPVSSGCHFHIRRCGMNKIRCLVVDDHILLRQGVRRLLEAEPDFEVVADVGDAAEALDKVRALRPDVVLMDIGMSGLSSFDAVKTIKQEFPATKVIFLT